MLLTQSQNYLSGTLENTVLHALSARTKFTVKENCHPKLFLPRPLTNWWAWLNWLLQSCFWNFLLTFMCATCRSCYWLYIVSQSEVFVISINYKSCKFAGIRSSFTAFNVLGGVPSTASRENNTSGLAKRPAGVTSPGPLRWEHGDLSLMISCRISLEKFSRRWTVVCDTLVFYM